MNQEEKILIVEHRETGKLQDSLTLSTPAKGAYIAWDDYKDFVYFDLPPFWSEELSKSYGTIEITNVSSWAIKLINKAEKKVIGYLERKENQYRKQLEAEQ